MSNDTHPKDKADVGKSMALWASKDVKNGRILLTFDDVGAGLRIKSGGKLGEFAVAGDDKKWHWAEAKLVGKNRIEVFSLRVSKSKAVRYAFNSYPRNPDPTNDAGLPGEALI
jgi:sialate O-acetylesterase